MAGIVRAITSDMVWIGVGPESAGRVSAMYTDRSTLTQVLRDAACFLTEADSSSDSESSPDAISNF
jgi:hypothetical protein